MKYDFSNVVYFLDLLVMLINIFSLNLVDGISIFIQYKKIIIGGSGSGESNAKLRWMSLTSFCPLGFCYIFILLKL